MAPGGSSPPSTTADVRLRDGGQLGHAGMHDPHTGGVDPEGVGHLARDEGGVGVDPGPPP